MLSHTNRSALGICLCFLLTPGFASVFRGDYITVTTERQINQSSVSTRVYETCTLIEFAGGGQTTGVDCVQSLLQFFLTAIVGAAKGYTVTTAESGFCRTQEFTNGSARRRGSDNSCPGPGTTNSAIFDENNDSGLRAVSIAASHIHPTDGFAIQTNVRGNGRPLFVHTNGTHAVTAFHEAPTIEQRELLPTSFQYFEFTGISGLKMEAQKMNGSLNLLYYEDLMNFATSFSELNVSSSFSNSDSWAYEVCSINSVPFFYGRIIAEECGFGRNYEPLSALGCP